MADFAAYRQSSAHTGADVASRFHPAAVLTARNAGTMELIPNYLYAVPFHTEHLHTADRLGIDITAAVAGARGTLAIYTTECWSLPFPSSLYLYVSHLAITAGQTHVLSHAALPLQRPSLFWLSCMVSASVQCAATDVGNQYAWAFFGYDPTSFSDAYAMMVASINYGNSGFPPDGYPGSFTLVGSAPPALGFRFSA